MEDQKERLGVLTEMVEQIAIVTTKLRLMQQQNGYGELNPVLYAEYKEALGNYIELDDTLKKLTVDIDKSDKTDIQDMGQEGAYRP